MKKVLFPLILLSFSFLNSSSQAPQKLWESFFDGTLTGKDKSNYVLTDSSGNVFVTGISFQTSGIGDFTTIKYNTVGAQQWADHYNISGSGTHNDGIKLILNKSQELYAIGTVASNAGDIAVVKYNANGKIWSHNYEPYWFGSDHDFGVDICTDSSGYVYFTGQITSLDGNLWDSYFVKCDSAGTKIFEEDFTSASGDDFPAGVAVTPGGNFFGLTNSYNFFGSHTYDIFTINYLSNGNQNWISRYDGDGNGLDCGTFIKADAHDNQYVCGAAYSGVNDDMIVMKQNQYGTWLWTTSYNGTANGNDTAVSTTWLPNGFVVATGKCREIVNGNAVDAFVTMVIDSGTIVWTQKFFGTDSLGAAPAQMITDEEGNIYICGFENLNGGTKNGCIIKYDNSGNLIWNISYDAGINLDDKFNSITLDNNNSIITTGQTFTNATNSNYVTVKYGNSATGIYKTDFSNYINIYPNPAYSSATISFELAEAKSAGIIVYDIIGNEVENIPSKSLMSGSNRINLDVSEWNSGVYIVQISSNNQSLVEKIIIEK